MFSYVSLEARVPPDHPLRAIRHITDRALERISPQMGTLYVNVGRPSVPPEQLRSVDPCGQGAIAVRRALRGRRHVVNPRRASM